MTWVQVGTTDVHYVESGSGPPLVFLHGFGSCAEAWYRQIDTLSDRFRVIAYDSVNHGHSSNSPAGQPEPDRADELEGFLAALGIGRARPVLAGNSMGALTILRWASRHPDDAAALVPSGMGVTTAAGSDAIPEATRRALFDPVTDDVLFLDALGGFNKGYADAHPVEYQRYVRLRSTASRIEASRHPREMSASDPTREELADRVGKISSPMQIVVGENDWLAGAARSLHELVAGSRLAVIPGAPHNVYWEAADAYNEVVSGFLGEVTGIRS